MITLTLRLRRWPPVLSFVRRVGSNGGQPSSTFRLLRTTPSTAPTGGHLTNGTTRCSADASTYVRTLTRMTADFRADECGSSFGYPWITTAVIPQKNVSFPCHVPYVGHTCCRATYIVNQSRLHFVFGPPPPPPPPLFFFLTSLLVESM